MRVCAALYTLLAACYEPEAVNCTVECAGADECADGQQCGSDGFCASPDVAGSCRANHDGESQSVVLMIAIEGRGQVKIDDVGMCDSEGPSAGACMFEVTPNVTRQLKAIEKDEREFISWTSTCIGATTSCSVTPVMALTQVGAKFK
jgi:hypothetical protein